LNESLTLQGFFGRLNLRQMLAPLLIILILSMMVLPLPTFVLDVFFTFNIAISIMGAAGGDVHHEAARLRDFPHGIVGDHLAAAVAERRFDAGCPVARAHGSGCCR
jgi:flagellar biosynthesis component FlhA